MKSPILFKRRGEAIVREIRQKKNETSKKKKKTKKKKNREFFRLFIPGILIEHREKQIHQGSGFPWGRGSGGEGGEGGDESTQGILKGLIRICRGKKGLRKDCVGNRELL